jgi:GNAT superfamily N-acetyltransferase
MTPRYEIKIYENADRLPPEAEQLFARQLADSRRGVPAWSFLLVCAVTPEERVLGGVYLDCGPIGGAGPLADRRLAYLERTLVRPEHRRQGLGTVLLRKALQVAADAGCLYVRCSNNWDNEAERRLFLDCGFALVDIDGEDDPEPCYLAVRPLGDCRSNAAGDSAKDAK